MGNLLESQQFAPGLDSRIRRMEALRGKLRCWEAASPHEEEETFSSGTAAIDRLLPGGALRYGMLIEWLAEPSATLALLGAREAARAGGVLVVVDEKRTFYPPAAAAWGIDLSRLVVVRPRNARDALWATVQALRSPVASAVWTSIARLTSRDFRRLQLAAQAARTLGVLLRPESARTEPSWADVRLEVVAKSPHIRREQPSSRSSSPAVKRVVEVRVVRMRGGRAGGSATVEIDNAAYVVREEDSWHDAHPLPMVTQLADPATCSQPARA